MVAEVTITAKALASELEMTGKKLRRTLRKELGAEHEKGGRWELTQAQADKVRAHFAPAPEVEAEV